MKKIGVIVLLIFWCYSSLAQQDSAVFFKFTTAQNRSNFYNTLIKNSITKNLSLPLSDSTESNWIAAFNAMELLYYQSPWTSDCLKTAANKLANSSVDFQRNFLELIYACQIKSFTQQTYQLLNNSMDPKVVALCGEYILIADSSSKMQASLYQIVEKKLQLLANKKDSTPYVGFLSHIKNLHQKDNAIEAGQYQSLFKKNYLRGNTILYSIQFKNRNYPGLVMIKDTTGQFVTDSSGRIFSVPQLAKSLSNLPFYLANGNTPQGIFRMLGFSKSRSYYIGPTPNIQLSLPVESSLCSFLKDSTTSDSVWKKEQYAKLLPTDLKSKECLYESFYAGAAGRTEIIAHGTTVDPNFYSGQSYYPFTPTAGCMCTKEIWDGNGRRIFSDQQKLNEAIKKAGGANGYCIVLEVDDNLYHLSPTQILASLQGIETSK